MKLDALVARHRHAMMRIECSALRGPVHGVLRRAFEPESRQPRAGPTDDHRHKQEHAMTEAWLYQVRVRLAPPFAEMVRTDPGNPALAALNTLLARHQARLKCQFDAFADYVAEAERAGTEHYPLYRWTRETIENPAKKAKYLEAFTLYVNGQEVYEGALADALEADLRALAHEGVTDIRRLDTNPANNPQPPSCNKA
jgi:hypothetical protein